TNLPRTAITSIPAIIKVDLLPASYSTSIVSSPCLTRSQTNTLPSSLVALCSTGLAGNSNVNVTSIIPPNISVMPDANISSSTFSVTSPLVTVNLLTVFVKPLSCSNLNSNSLSPSPVSKSNLLISSNDFVAVITKCSSVVSCVTL